MHSPSRLALGLGPLLLCFLSACTEAPTTPSVTAPADRFESADNRQLLLAILDKLDALERRAESESRLMYARIDSVARVLSVGVPQGVQRLKPSAGIEAQICAELGGRSRGHIQAKTEIKGRGLGSVGVHAGGNGAWAGAFAQAGSVTGVITDGRISANLEICAKVGAESELAPSVRALLNDALAAANGVTSNLATLATVYGMDATRMNTGIAALNSFSLGNLPVGQGAAAGVLAGLPLPSELRSLLANPRQIFQRTGDAVQFGIDEMCSSSNWPSPVAQRVNDACALRNQFPSAQNVLALLQALDGLPSVLNQLGADTSDLCAAVNAMRPASFTIPAHSVNIPPSGTFTTFPGYSRTLFPGLAAVC